MDQTARRRRRNLIQNIAIALLSVSAVLLFAQLQLYNLGTSEDPLYLERLTGEGSPSRLREFPAPVRVVLTDSYGRYGSLGFTTNSDGFSALGLREALGSVQHLAPSTTDAFRGALSGPSIYFDFLNPLPLQVLAELTGAEGTALPLYGENITIRGNGTQTRCFLYIDDAVEALVRMMGTDGNLSKPINIGGIDPMRIDALAEDVVNLTGSSSKTVRLNLTADSVQHAIPDIRYARQRLGWEPLVPIEEGLVRTIKYFKNAMKSEKKPFPFMSWVEMM